MARSFLNGLLGTEYHLEVNGQKFITGLLRPRHSFRSLDFRKSSTGLLLPEDLLRGLDIQRTIYSSSEFRIPFTNLFYCRRSSTGLLMPLVFYGQNTIKKYIMARISFQVLYSQKAFYRSSETRKPFPCPFMASKPYLCLVRLEALLQVFWD